MPRKVALDRRDGGVVVLTLDNPDRRNAVDMELRESLAGHLEALQQDDSARVVVLTGRGGHFSSGGDVKEWRDFSVAEARRRLQAIQRPVRAILRLEKPVIAMIRGYAVGAGMNLALACDLLVASEGARFGQTFVRMGLIPDAGGLCLLPLAVGLHRAKELMFTGEIIEAQEALRLGIVNRVLPEETLESETLALAVRLAQGPPMALGLMKRIMNGAFLGGLEALLEQESLGQSLCFLTGDHREGKAAFAERRAPRFTGA
jgi:2-(1,2-epoxy-1,2-dihydrophenyl)acetyl-CoA isomerase